MADPLLFKTMPSGLPRPVDDGAADHLRGMALPAVALKATNGEAVALDQLPPGRTVIYVYPMTGRPDVPLPEGWDEIPGARGCTPESLGFKSAHAQIRALDVVLYGLSTQGTDYQREAVQRLGLPFPILSDAGLKLTQALNLPTFEAGGMTLLKRLTLVVRDGTVEHVFYPVFPSDTAAPMVLDWLHEHPLVKAG